jgi:hypothetical protein
MKPTAVIMEVYHDYQLHTKFYPAFTYQGQQDMLTKLLVSSVWNCMYQINYLCILHISDTGEKMEIPLRCTPATYELQQGLWFSLEGGFV